MTALKDQIIEQGFEAGALTWNDDLDVFEFMVTATGNGNGAAELGGFSQKKGKPIKIGRGLISSKDFQTCMSLSRQIYKYDEPPFVVFSAEKNDRQKIMTSKEELLDYMLEEGKKGIGIQRYKGLGEMNPDQLWETTMNPEKRTLMQVKIEDAVETDEIFTILMGDEVEPRREFIQSNALEVSTLDI